MEWLEHAHEVELHFHFLQIMKVHQILQKLRVKQEPQNMVQRMTKDYEVLMRGLRCSIQALIPRSLLQYFWSPMVILSFWKGLQMRLRLREVFWKRGKHAVKFDSFQTQR